MNPYFTRIGLIFLMLFKISVFTTKAQEKEINQVLSLVEAKHTQYKAKIDAAFAAMDAVKKTESYIKSLSDLIGNGEINLPVGIKKGEYELIIQKITYDEKTGKSDIFATCAFTFKDNGQRIAFEGNATLVGKKGLGTNGSLKLIAPVRRDIGKEATIIFKEGTCVNFGCKGIESVFGKMTFMFTSKKIFAVKADGSPSRTPISSDFEANLKSFDNFTASLSFNQSFSIKGLKDIVFTLKGAILDQNDSLTSAQVKFPKNYFANTKNNNEKKLWKGVSISQASIMLPAIFKKTKTNNKQHTDSTKSTALNNRISIGLKNALFDENGFSGWVETNNILSSDAIDKSKWDISINDFSLNILKNDVTGFGFGGDLNIPPLGKSSLLPYTAKFNPALQEYVFTANVSGEFDFPVLRSKLSLNKTSTVEVLFEGNELYPTLNASGKLSIDAPINKSDTTKRFVLPDVTFENLRISRKKPYVEIGAIGVSGDIKSPKIAGFQLSISNIKPFKDHKGSGLAFDAGIKLNEMFGGDAGLLLYGDYARWKFKKVDISKIDVNFTSKAFSLKGGVMFKNGDETYGSGFRGNVAIKVIDRFDLEAIAVFGKVDGYRYFLADAFLELPPISGIPVPPALSFYGFGGGMYKHMQQSYTTDIDTEFGKSLSGIHYVPDRRVGMGFMAATRFCLLGAPSTFNANVSFEMQFNQHGGLNFIQLRGDAAFMNKPKWGKLANSINDKVKKIEKSGGKLKLAAKNDLKVPENKSSGFLTASMNIKYDLTNKAFSSELSTYLNAGFIKGVGPNDRLGWASAYFAPDKWYTYMGTPTNRLGVKVLGLAQLDGYFMLGDDIPELPPPPQKVLQNLSESKQQKFTHRSEEEQATGKGIAFGQSMSVNFKAKLPPFYAKFGVGLGAEFLLKNYGTSAYCLGGNSTVGINGWYARAQAWAWVEAGVGIEVKLFAKRRKFSILDISASTLLEGAGPNPFYFAGAVGGKFNVLGGLVSGHCNFDFEIGEECIVAGGNPFGADIIAQLTPSSGQDDVNVFAAPQAIFNIPIDKEMRIEENGKTVMYKVTLEKFKAYYKDSKKTIEGYPEISNDGKLCMIDPADPFESKKDIVVYAKVGFKRKLNSGWVNVKGADGNPVYEIKKAEFKSGERPKEILPEHIKYSYPVAKQYNYYPKEYKAGYILVSENYSYLFSSEKPEGFDQKIMITDTDGKNQKTSFNYKTNSIKNDIRLEINFSTEKINFKNDEIYKMAIVNIPQNNTSDISSNITTSVSNLGNNKDVNVTTQQAKGTLNILEQKEIYALHFRTSSYNTFVEKMSKFDTEGTGWRDYVEPFVHHIKANISDTEFFDKNEMQLINEEPSLIQFEALIEETKWYKRSVYRHMYDQKYIGIEESRGKISCNYGYPPVKSVLIENNINDRQLTEDEIATGTATGTYANGIFTYALPYWCSRDFYFIKTHISNKIVNNLSLTKEEKKLLETDYPPVVTKGEYPVKVRYVLPGKNITTSTINIKMYNPI